MKPRKPLQIRAVSGQSPADKPAGMSGRVIKPVDTSFAVAPARREAFAILVEIEKASAASTSHSDDLLRAAGVSALSIQDRHLTTTLVMGTLRWQMQLDARIRPLLAKPYGRMDAEVRTALRLGAFQLLFLDRIPVHAAIGESVALAKRAGQKFASGMVNAVLRKLAAEAKAEVIAPTTSKELAEATAHPDWLVERWIAHYGFEAAQAICRHGQRQPELAVRVERVEVERELVGHGIELAPGAILTAARRVVSGDIAANAAFRGGEVQIQEEGSQLIGELAGYGSRILDCCAAPGGKTLILAERNPGAHLTAVEISSARLEALKARVATTRFASQIEARHGDATQLEAGLDFDLALVDAPCSGTGTLGRNPEIRHRLQSADLVRHHERQCALLRAALRVGSRRVVYSTCSLEPEENADVVREVLQSVSGWCQVSVSMLLGDLNSEGRLTSTAAVSLEKAIAPDGSLTLLPGSLGIDHAGEEIQTDGFFVAVLEKLVT